MSKNDIELPPMPEWAIYQRVENAVQAYAIAAIKADRKHRGEPEGWQLVPIEPTYEMLEEIHINENFKRTAMETRYKAMLAAAPKFGEDE